jgi:hypothetical protein
VEVLTMKKPIITILIIAFAVNAFGWASSARRYSQSNRSPRQVYEANRNLEGRTSAAMEYMREHNEEHHLGPSPLVYSPYFRYKQFDRDEKPDHHDNGLYMDKSNE